MDRANQRPIRSLATSLVYFLACGFLIALWVRSYYLEDRASGHFSSSLGVRFYSSRGWIVCSKSNTAATSQNYPWALQLGSDTFWLEEGDDRLRFQFPRAFFGAATFVSISIPHWIPVFLSGVLAAIFATRRTVSVSGRCFSPRRSWQSCSG